MSGEEIRNATGVDVIILEIIKDGGETGMKTLYKIFPLEYKEKQAPRDWSRMINKLIRKGDNTNLRNYLSISFLSCRGVRPPTRR